MVRPEPFYRGFQGFLIDIEDRDARAVLGEQSRSREANSTSSSRPRNDCGLAAQKHGVLPRLCTGTSPKTPLKLKRELYND